ncbi:hypothetical protein D3C85_1623820 [compost metagenome]
MGEFVARQYRFGALVVQSHTGGNIRQLLRIGRIAAISEIRFEQRFLELQLHTFEPRPVQQAMSVERVVDSAVAVGAKRESQFSATLADHFAVLFRLLG